MRRGQLFENRDFVLLWGGETLSEVGSQSSAVAYPLLVLALTHSSTDAGVVGLARWLPLALFSLPAGVLADRVDRKRLMIVCDLVRLLGAGSIALALLIGQPALFQIVVVAFLEGGLGVTSFICERGALPQVVAPEQLHDAVATNEARMYAAGIVGPSLGGLLFAAARSLPVITDAGSYLGSMTAIAATRSSFKVSVSTSGRSLRTVHTEIAEGIRWLWSRPFFRTTSLLFAAGNPVYTGLYLLSILLARHYHASPATIGVMLTIASIGGLLGAVLAAPVRRNLGARGVLVGETWLVLGLVLLMLVAHNALLIGLIVGAAEFTAPPANALVAGSRSAVAPDHLQGRIQSAATALSASLVWLGPLAVGYLFGHLGPTKTVLTAAVWTLALAIAATAAPSIKNAPPVATAEDTR
jgi:MFS family permease